MKHVFGTVCVVFSIVLYKVHSLGLVYFGCMFEWQYCENASILSGTCNGDVVRLSSKAGLYKYIRPTPCGFDNQIVQLSWFESTTLGLGCIAHTSAG